MYEYISGLIRVLEKQILDQTDLERMLGAKDAVEAFQVLNNTDYADNLLNLKPEEYSQALERDLKDLRSLLFKTVENKNLLKFIFLKFDFHNIKYLLKIKYRKNLKLNKNNLSGLGIEKPQTIQRLILHKKTKKIGPEKAKADQTIEQGLENILKKIQSLKKIKPEQIDLLTDLEFFQAKKNLSKKIKDGFVQKLNRLQIDLANLKILLRKRNMQNQLTKHKPFKKQTYGLKKNLITGGTFRKQHLLHLLLQEEDNFFKNLSEYLEEHKIIEVLQDYQKTKKLWHVEKSLQDLELSFIKREARACSYGPAIILSYCWQKFDAARKIRIIMNAKLNKIGFEELKQRII